MGWVGSPGGSSGLLISSFIRGAVMSADHAHVFQHGREEALTLLDTVRFEEQPQPNGLDLAFRILVAMESQQRTPFETLQAASPAISIVAHHNDNYGFRCFSTFVEGFLGL
jgi:hypothetical protein